MNYEFSWVEPERWRRSADQANESGHMPDFGAPIKSKTQASAAICRARRMSAAAEKTARLLRRDSETHRSRAFACGNAPLIDTLQLEHGMHTKTITTFCEIAATKAEISLKRPFAFLVSSAMAGAYVGIGIILI